MRDPGFVDPAPWFDETWVECIRCDGSGEYIECYDDLCHGLGRCFHGHNTCAVCEGVGLITMTLAERWRSRGSFESVTAPDADLYVQGKLHGVARERHDRGERDVE